MYLAVTPSDGIAAAGGTSGAPSGPPVAADQTSALYRMDPGGTLYAMGNVTLYNASPVDAVPDSVLATVGRTVNGHYYCQTWPGQANPGAVIVDPEHIPYQHLF